MVQFFEKLEKQAIRKRKQLKIQLPRQQYHNLKPPALKHNIGHQLLDEHGKTYFRLSRLVF